MKSSFLSFLKTRLKQLLTAFCLLQISIANGQQLTYKKYTNANGLPSNEVFGMAIDKKGYLWICTDKGIAKFDGTNFEIYTSLHGLKDNVFFNITHDYKDRIWMWSFNQNFNYISEGKIYTYKYNDLINKLKKRKFLISRLMVGKDDKMFFNIDDEYFSISHNGHVEYYDNIMFSKRVIIVLKNGQLYSQGVQNFNLDDLKNDKWFIKKFIQERKIVELYTKNMTNYFYSENELLVKDVNQRTIRRFEERIVSVCVDNRKQLWISINSGNVIAFNNLNDKPKTILKRTDGKLLCDRNGNVWFSDSYRGLYKFHSTFIEEYELKDANVASVLLPLKDKLILGSYNHKSYEYRFDLKGFAQHKEIKNLFEFLESIFYNQDKVEFYGTLNGGVVFGKDTVTRIKTIQKVDFGYVIGSHFDYYFVYDSLQKVKKEQTNNIRIKDLQYIDSNQLFFAALDGIYTLNLKNGVQKKIADKAYRNEHTQVIKRKDDLLFFGTKGKGMAIYSLKEGRVVSFYNSQNSEMPNSINAIHIKENLIWIGTNQGIFVYEINDASLKFKYLLNVNNGLSSNDVLGLSIIDKDLYCINENKLNHIDLNNPDNFRTPIPDAPEFLQIKIKGKPTKIQKKIQTNYKNNDIEFHYNSAYLLDKSRISYKYKLANYDNKWQSTTSNFINYDNLPPGEYELKIYTSLDNDKSKSESIDVEIVVTQPFWLTLKFRVISIILIAFLLFGLVSFYFYQKSKKVKQKMQVIEYQQQALRAQMKPHFIFNALNSIQNFMLKNNVPDALDFIEKFSILTRTILNVTETELSTIEEELKTTKHYMDIEKIRFRNFDYKILISDEAKSSSILVPSLILQPIVENAIWHGFQKKTEQKPGLILVSVSVENHKMEITIEDNGVGRKVTEKIASHKSKGLSTLRKRLELLNKSKVKIDFIDLYEDNVPTGTKVLITLVQKN